MQFLSMHKVLVYIFVVISTIIEYY
jgi:hypothetical protein